METKDRDLSGLGRGEEEEAEISRKEAEVETQGWIGADAGAGHRG